MGRVDSVGVALQPNGQQKVAPSAGAAVFPPLTSEGIEPTIARLEHSATIGSRAPEKQKRGGRSYGGTLEGGVRPNSVGTLFTMAFGEPVSSTSVGTGVWRHIWNPVAANKNPMPAYIWTVNADDPDEIIVDEYMGAMIDELAFTIEPNDYLLFTATIQAIRNIEGGTAPVATRDITELWSFDEVGAEISVPSISAGAWAPIALFGWNFSYGNSLAGGDRFPLGSKEIVRLRPGNINSTVGFTAAEAIESHYRRAIADNPELVRMRLNAKGRSLGGGNFESLALEFKAIEYNSGNVAINAEETLEDIEIEGNAVLDGTGQLLTITLTNQHDGTKYRAPAA